jgi:hypothetical protein
MSSSAEAATQSTADNVVFGVFVLALIVGLGFCLRTVIEDHSQASSIAAANPCRPGVRHGCLNRQHAVVTSADSEGLTVTYDDGRRTADLGSVGETYPELGTRVVLESWNSAFVSALDPVSKHRYRGSDWPKVWNGGAIFGVIAISAVLAYIGFAWLDDRPKAEHATR